MAFQLNAPKECDINQMIEDIAKDIIAGNYRTVAPIDDTKFKEWNLEQDKLEFNKNPTVNGAIGLFFAGVSEGIEQGIKEEKLKDSIRKRQYSELLNNSN
jgi:hypothetical protein